MKSLLRTSKVLVVEDDDDTRQLLLQFIRDTGFETAGARTAQEALKVLRTGRIDAILTDYAMDPAGETGCWMLECAQKEGLLADVRLIAICTGSPHVDAPASLPRVMVTCKPMDLNRMRTELTRALEG